MSALSRRKGSKFERDVCDAFSDALGLEGEQRIKRNIGQARDGGNDVDVGPLVVEVKIRKTLGTVYAWLQQAMDAARKRFFSLDNDETTPKIPIVVARQDGDTSPIVILRLSDFLILTRDELKAHYE